MRISVPMFGALAMSVPTRQRSDDREPEPPGVVPTTPRAPETCTVVTHDHDELAVDVCDDHLHGAPVRAVRVTDGVRHRLAHAQTNVIDDPLFDGDVRCHISNGSAGCTHTRGRCG